MAYKWNTAQEWLSDAVDSGRVDKQALLRLVLDNVDGDDIQFMFQEEMDRDGYFEEEDDAGSA